MMKILVKQPLVFVDNEKYKKSIKINEMNKDAYLHRFGEQLYHYSGVGRKGNIWNLGQE